MRKLNRAAQTAILCVGAITLLAGCSRPPSVPTIQVTPAVTSPAPQVRPPVVTTPAPAPAETQTKPTPGGDKPTAQLAEKPTDIGALINKRYMLPDGYRPADLVEPNIPFIFKEQDEKRLMRKEAAQALERMFAAAKQGGVNLAGVSGFRSFETQRALFDYYVRTQGEDVARKYSAEPGHSEHQTGLAMDVSGSTGQCAADDCFANTPEANWLAAHSAEYGFIIRYPKGKEAITGYNYEPWHVRYVGTALSKPIAAKGQTLEEYFGKVN
jgi:zinc D-Ala-D-Ala carboxypeptidase